jgi:hypothetical protein
VFNNSCWGEVHAGKPLAEFHNVHLGGVGEAGWSPPAATRHRPVVAVEAGPAGLEAAWVAAAGGHAVTLLGASATPGGKLALEARLPGHAEMARVIDHQLALAAQHGVQLRLGQPADERAVLELAPDEVIIVTGARLRRPQFLDGTQATTPRVLSAHEFARRWGPDDTVRRGTALLYDHDHGAAVYAVAEALAASHRSTVIVTPRTHIAQAANYCSALGVFRRLCNQGVEIVPACEPVRLGERSLTLRNVFSGAERVLESVATFVFATPRQASDELAARLEAQVPVRLVGDAMAPRNLLIAIHEGRHAALAIGG